MALNGTNGGDFFRGTRFGDEIFGFGGDDTIAGSPGRDEIDGGSGVDTVDYLEFFDIGFGVTHWTGANPNFGDEGVDVDLQRAAQIGGFADGDSLTGIENVFGTIHSDTIRGDGNANELRGAGGSDTLEGRGGNDLIYGDQIRVNDSNGDGFQQIGDADGDDRIDGGAGNDTLIGGGGADTLIGGDNFDFASYSNSPTGVTASLAGGAGSGTAAGDVYIGIEGLIGSDFNDLLIGDAGGNRIDGGDGNDTLIGGRGNDDLRGDAGIDTVDYSTSASAVSVVMFSGNGLGFGGDAAGDALRGIENVAGSAFNDSLTGDANANVLSGRSGADTLSGGGGADTIFGGAGADDMTGGAGADRFLFAAVGDIANGANGQFDIIRDFVSGEDKIDLRFLGNLTAVGSFQGIAGQVQFVNGALNGVDTPALVIDVNGDNVADHAVFVQTANGVFPQNGDLIIL